MYTSPLQPLAWERNIKKIGNFGLFFVGTNKKPKRLLSYLRGFPCAFRVAATNSNSVYQAAPNFLIRASFTNT